MPEEKVSVVIFEGGAARTAVEDNINAVRRAVVLDNVEKLHGASGVDEIILCTNYRDLAGEAERLGATVDFSDGPFHFGRRLLETVKAHALTNVFYMGGPAAPLIRRKEVTWVADRLRAEKNIVVLNNVQSPDMVGFTPASALSEVPPPANDNELGYILRENAGLRRVLMPNSAWINFDLDTPTDLAILSMQETAGPRTKEALQRFDFDLDKLVKLRGLFGIIGAEVALIGRVGPPVWAFLNMNFMCRFRVFSEERGMKALGRQERGEVISLVGHLIDQEGPEAFFRYLSTFCQSVIFDSRVLFAHWKLNVSDWDRFQSDLGRYDLVKDPKVREFTRAAVEAPVPVILGGHALVSGGLWILAENVLAAEGREARRIMRF
ncbi:MAG: hypothetical protein ACYC6I_05320 [Bacillota bacterium]